MLLEKMVEKILGTLHSPEEPLPYGTLTGSITATATTFPINSGVVNSSSTFRQGIWEIGTELVYVQNFNIQTNVASGVLRGWGGSTAAPHGAGTGVVFAPPYPRSTITETINRTIISLYPDIYAVKTLEIINAGVKNKFELPADTLNVIDVSFYSNFSSQTWSRSRQWRFDGNSGYGTTTNKALEVGDAPSGYRMKVVYQAKPTPLTYGQDFTVSGLPDYAEEVVEYGTIYRLLTSVDPQRVKENTASQKLLQDKNQIGSGSNLVQLYNGLYNQFKTEAQARQAKENPARFHWI